MELQQRGEREPVAERKDVLSTPATAKFVYMHHPEGWEFSATRKCWLPRLKKLQLRPGCCGVKGKANDPQWSETKAQHEDRGFVFIPLGIAVRYMEDGQLLTNDTEYRRRWAARGGYAWGDVWSTPVQIGHGRRTRVVWEFDHEGFDAWRIWLVETGVIPQPLPSVLSNIVSIQQRRTDRTGAMAHAGAPPIIQHKHAVNQGRLDAMTADTEKPIRRRRGRGKKATADE